MHRHARSANGQVLVIVALGIIVLLGAAGIAIDVGRLMAERRHLQTAADAGALAACQALVSGATVDMDAAALRAREVAAINIDGSPAGAAATIAASPVYEDQDGSGFLDPDELVSGVVVSGSSARVAIKSTIETTLARVVGIPTMDVGARAHCGLIQNPAIPIVARRYDAPPGPGGGFVDVLATEATSSSGRVDANPLGYDVRTAASTAAPGPLFSIYGPGSKALNSSSFRGFINLDIRDFRDVSERDYYNGARPGVNENTMKAEQAEYILTGYPGPGFPAVTTTPTGDLQVATLSGNSSGHVVDAFGEMFDGGDRVMLAVYDGTVKAIPDFSITPPSQITLPTTTSSPQDGQTFTVSRNNAFLGSVSLELLGDALAPNPADNILPVPGSGPPAAGKMNEPVFNPDGFTFASNQSSRSVALEDMSTNAVSPGIYTVWVKGTSSIPTKSRRHPVPVYVGGATRGFHLNNSSLDASAAALGDAVTYTIRVKSENWQTGSPATQVGLSWDSGSLTDCLLVPVAAPPSMSVTFSAPLVTPANGQGAASTMTVDTDGLPSGCYMFTVRAHATNRDGQPVTRLANATLYVAAQPSAGEYVEIMGFAMFEISDVSSNTITGRAISPICADPQCAELRLVQRARLIPWS
ncbi:MAG TPA: pilus assembly protein TadG-related protein, partial [Candidatus Limnocylindrales bacterium]|nr:pilus assembly protein TadG-related protein [Candidatus Limnocylindrales bacterium]